MVRSAPLAIALLLGACAAPTGLPTLAPRAAETIDPRLPVAGPTGSSSVEPALARQLARLVGDARRGDGAFETRIADARGRAAAAGGPRTEGWIEAQQALSAAVAAREPVTRALGDIDSLAAAELAREGGIAAGNYAAIRNALAEVGEIDSRQARSVDALRRRLGG